MPDGDGQTVVSIRDLTQEVISRTMAALREKLSSSEFEALEEVVSAGGFLDSMSIISAIARAQAREVK